MKLLLFSKFSHFFYNNLSLISIMILRDFLLRVKWDPAFSEIQNHLFIEIVDREVDSGIKTIKYTSIDKILKKFIVLKDSGTMIPMHRIKKVASEKKVYYVN